MPARLARSVAVVAALVVVVGTGVAWGKIRSFEERASTTSVPRRSAAAVRTARSTSCSSAWTAGPTRTATRCRPRNSRRCAPATTWRPTPTRSSWSASRTTVSRRPRSRSRATRTWRRPGFGKTKINGVFGEVKLEKMKELVEEQGEDPATAEPKRRGGPRGADRDRRQADRRHRRPLRRDRPARLRADHRRSRRRRRLPEGRRLRTTFGRRLPRRLAEAGRPAGAELRPAAARPSAR